MQKLDLSTNKQKCEVGKGIAWSIRMAEMEEGANLVSGGPPKKTSEATMEIGVDAEWFDFVWHLCDFWF